MILIIFNYYMQNTLCIYPKSKLKFCYLKNNQNNAILSQNFHLN